MLIIQKKRAWIGPMRQQGERSSWCDGMIPLIGSLYVGLQCIGRGYKLLNPGLTFKIIGIIHEIMRIIIVFVWLNMSALLHKASLPGHPRLISHLWVHRTTIGVCQLLKNGMQNPDIIRNNSKNNWYNSDIIVI